MKEPENLPKEFIEKLKEIGLTPEDFKRDYEEKKEKIEEVRMRMKENLKFERKVSK